MDNAKGKGASLAEERLGADPLAMIELLYFAYRDFTTDGDRVLAALDFGRAHHRVLHFVNRNPGLRVADLLGILRITKQSLARVLKQLIEQGYIEQRAGAEDRRERLLYPSERGRVLAMQLMAPQIERIAQATAMASNLGTDGRPSEGSTAIERFLLAMIDPDDRAKVTRLIRGSSGHGGLGN